MTSTLARTGLLVSPAIVGLLLAVAHAQQPPAPPPASCEDQLDGELFQKGEVLKQWAIARAQLRAVTKERDDARAALTAATAPKPAEKK